MAFFNEVTLRRMRSFRRRKTAYYALWIFLVMFIIGMVPELVANDRPYFMTYQGELYFPIFKDYHPKEFGVHDTFLMDYKEFREEMGDEVKMLFPPVIWGPYTINKAASEFPGPPTWENWLGTDDRGRDVVARLVYGFRTSMAYALGVWILAFSVGIVFGAIQGYFGGKVELLRSATDGDLAAIPYFFLLIILISIFQPGIMMLVALSSLFGWAGICMYIRAEFLRLRKFDFVEASRALGQRNYKVLFKQILPNALTPVVTFSPFAIAGGVTGLAGLDYLGFGVPPPTPSWGELMAQGHRLFDVAPWLAFSTLFALFITLSLLNLVGEGVRHAFDPRKY